MPALQRTPKRGQDARAPSVTSYLLRVNDIEEEISRKGAKTQSNAKENNSKSVTVSLSREQRNCM